MAENETPNRPIAPPAARNGEAEPANAGAGQSTGKADSGQATSNAGPDRASNTSSGHDASNSGADRASNYSSGQAANNSGAGRAAGNAGRGAADAQAPGRDRGRGRRWPPRRGSEPRREGGLRPGDGQKRGEAAAARPRPPATEWFQDLRQERLRFELEEVWDEGKLAYRWSGAPTPPPPLTEPRGLSREQCIEIYRWMLLNRTLEQQLENLYKQSRVVGGVYFGLGQEGCSVASAYALGPADWMAPMIRNQGSLLVRGFRPRDIMMQYMARADSPTGGKDGTSHFGDLGPRRVVSPISMLGDLIPVMTGVCLGERLQGREIAAMTWIGDGGQSAGVFHEGLNLAAVQNLGLVLIVENNLWAYSTPLQKQTRIRDLAIRARAYGIAAIIVDGTDPFQVHAAARQAIERAHAGQGPTLIEAKLMRMKGHAIHDPAAYVPPAMLEFWRRRDPIARLEDWLAKKGWLASDAQAELRREVEQEVLAERDAAEASPLPPAERAFEGVYCEGCHDPRPRFLGRRRRGGADEPQS